ncbi:hypothetical protein DCAR_0205326 [Daucus carota subsp. sativus]|uniref:NB-ARC domain-containing protein n=1 Tax=Daucus carota subsp. sativus TaxID=79200 RepID=A0AAF0WC69_DAUCS|nr:hypothetical protein DCAR_0205326 [Daucus carota subsp. sativus]
MAEAVVSFAVERLGELLISEAKHLLGVEKEIKYIQDELVPMKGLLKEADKKQNRDETVRKCVLKMRELAFKIEDVVETFALEVRAKQQISGFMATLLRIACILDEWVRRHNIATEINDIKDEIHHLFEILQKCGVIESLKGENSRSLVDLKSRRTYSHDVERDFVGMENEIEQLISHLKNKDNGCEVVSICGMGGLGKTTLAKKLYNHVEIKAHFEAFAWVCITQQFEKEKVFKGLLKQLLPATDVSKMDDAKVVKELYKVQQGKNCLIVIDDIWSVKSWVDISAAFPVQDTTGNSKILLTTRNEIVAKKSEGSIYKIQGLTEEQGWQLLSKKAGISRDPSGEMEEIGRNMVKRCRGLPLAISTLGGLLKGELLSEWERINRNISSYLSRGESVADEYGSVKWVLGMSYDSLLPHLRHCFLCFANYKEDEIIDTMGLYMHWIAQGLIRVEDKREGEMMLDVAERYLDELVYRSLVQIEPITIEEEGEFWLKYNKCRVHDLILDLCRSKAQEENFTNLITDLRDPPDPKLKPSITRRLCIHSDGDDVDLSMLANHDEHIMSLVRYLLFFNHYKDCWPLPKILGLETLKLLRVLTAGGYKFSKQDMTSISELIYLKYLCLCNCYVEEIPTSFGNLTNLETLDLRVNACVIIPNFLCKLEHLKRLYLPQCCLVAEKLRLEGLDDLELLYNYNSEYCDSKDLIQLRRLKVFDAELSNGRVVEENIIHFIKHREWRYSSITIMGGVLCLVYLLECRFIDFMRIQTRICKLPKEYDHTHFSRRLRFLNLAFCEMEEDPMIVLEKLPNLHSLEILLKAYLGEEMVCSATGFPELMSLYLGQMDCLKKLSLHRGTMPKIRKLHIYNCRKLEMIPEELTHLTTLEHTKIW